MPTVITDIQRQVMESFDSKVKGLSKEDYRDLLEEMIADWESRHACVSEEIDAEENS